MGALVCCWLFSCGMVLFRSVPLFYRLCLVVLSVMAGLWSRFYVLSLANKLVEG
jgi:hypothetical protein